MIVTLGKVAFDNCMKLYKQKFNIKKKFVFKHGKTQSLPNGLIILSSYHPSPRNVNTNLITNQMMVNLFKKAKKLAYARHRSSISNSRFDFKKKKINKKKKKN